MATLLILEPIFEADFLDCSYGFRSGGSAHDALEEIRAHLQAGYQAVYDAELSSPGESHPEALPEPYVSVSTHTAPMVKTGPCVRSHNASRVGCRLITRRSH